MAACHRDGREPLPQLGFSNAQPQDSEESLLELQELSLALMLLLGAVNERIFQEHQIAPKLHLSQNQATEGLQRGLLTGVQLRSSTQIVPSA